MFSSMWFVIAFFKIQAGHENLDVFYIPSDSGGLGTPKKIIFFPENFPENL